MQKKDIITISATDKRFPDSFNRVLPKIDQFYAVGNLRLLDSEPRISIVGTRKPTAYGAQVTKDFTQAVARSNVTVISGLAFGVDSIAHETALKYGGTTIAVLPGGLQNIYPLRHTELARRIVEKGGLLISEYKLSAPLMPYYFVRRNRLIAALSETTLVTEAGEKSGSIHTADFAMELGKNVCVIPGNITNPLSIGSNKLIKEGAEPVVSIEELLTIVGVHGTVMKPRYSAENEYEQSILKGLQEQDLSGDALFEQSNLDIATFNVNLTMLEIKGAIEQTAGNCWRLAK